MYLFISWEINVIFIFVKLLVDLNKNNKIMSVNVNLKYETKNIEKNKHKKQCQMISFTYH